MVPSKNIVIVDDEVETVELFSEMMRLAGFQVFKSFEIGRAHV